GPVVPGLVATTIFTSSSRFDTARPLYSTTTSPGSMPALPAALFGRTDETTAPVRVLSPSSSKFSRGTTPTLTPIRPRITLPSRSCGSRSRTVLMGTAKPMPMLPSDWPLLMMASRRATSASARAEEHTSELQSPDHLVGRVLLEKKKLNECEQCYTVLAQTDI